MNSLKSRNKESERKLSCLAEESLRRLVRSHEASSFNSRHEANFTSESERLLRSCKLAREWIRERRGNVAVVESGGRHGIRGIYVTSL